MKRVCLLGAGHRDRREVTRSGLLRRFDVVFDQLSEAYFSRALYHPDPEQDRDFSILEIIDAVVHRCAGQGIDGVISGLDHPGASLAFILARALGLPGPDPAVAVRCQNKALAREDQHQVVPEATPAFAVVPAAAAGQDPPPLPFPFFIKPVKAFLSAFAMAIPDMATWRSLAHRDLIPHVNYRKSFDDLMAHVGVTGPGADCLIAEAMLDGEQVTLDGFVLGGEVHVLGITDSHMYPGTISFSRFQYPSRFPAKVQARMGQIAARYIRAIGLDDCCFNIEFFYRAKDDQLAIIELNPRFASGFADLYEKVEGVNLFEIAMDVATGQTPRRRGGGDFTVAAAFPWRVFTDCHVVSVPETAQVESLTGLYPDVRLEIFAKPGYNLSYNVQDEGSFRLALIHLGARDETELMVKYAHCQQHLPIKTVAAQANTIRKQRALPVAVAEEVFGKRLRY